MKQLISNIQLDNRILNDEELARWLVQKMVKPLISYIDLKSITPLTRTAVINLVTDEEYLFLQKAQYADIMIVVNGKTYSSKRGEVTDEQSI